MHGGAITLAPPLAISAEDVSKVSNILVDAVEYIHSINKLSD